MQYSNDARYEGDEITIAAVPAIEIQPGDVYVDRRGEALLVVNRSQRCGYVRLQTQNLSSGNAWGDWEITPLCHLTRIRGLNLMGEAA